MNKAVSQSTIDLEEIEATLTSLDGNISALAQLIERLGRNDLASAFRYIIQMQDEHHTTLKWHLGLPLHRSANCGAARIEGGAHA
ncbi:MAG: hypothetical protein JSR89_18330 [Proteobacteria bacterium]|nr:hypothetical protein [Pseudomonadota bacterium]